MGLFRRCHELSAPLSFPALAPDLGDLESVFDVFENGAGNDAIDTLIWDVRGQFMGVGDEVYVLPRLIVHTDIRGRVKGPGAMAGVALSRVSPCSIHREQAGDGCGGGLRRLLSVVTPFRCRALERSVFDGFEILEGMRRAFACGNAHRPAFFSKKSTGLMPAFPLPAPTRFASISNVPLQDSDQNFYFLLRPASKKPKPRPINKDRRG